MLPVGCDAVGYGSSLRTDSALTDFPEPDSPTSATHSPRLISNEIRSTASEMPLGWGNATERSRTSSRGWLMASMALDPYRNDLRGSNASRTASPMKIKSDSMMATAKKPVKPSHGAWTLALPCDSSSPSEGEPGGNPKPRKSSAVSVITEEETMNGRNVMVATMAFGRKCRNMITPLETPSARAAMMYSKLRPRRNSARTRPTSETQENSKSIPSSTKKPGTSTEDRINSKYSD